MAEQTRESIHRRNSNRAAAIAKMAQRIAIDIENIGSMEAENQRLRDMVKALEDEMRDLRTWYKARRSADIREAAAKAMQDAQNMISKEEEEARARLELGYISPPKP